MIQGVQRHQGSGFRVSGFGCRVSGIRFRVLGFGFRVSHHVIQGVQRQVHRRRVLLQPRQRLRREKRPGSGFHVSGFGYDVPGFVSRFGYDGFGFYISNFEFRVSFTRLYWGRWSSRFFTGPHGLPARSILVPSLNGPGASPQESGYSRPSSTPCCEVLPVYLSIYIHISFCLSIYLSTSIYIYISLSFYLSIYLSIYKYMYIYIYIYTYIYIYMYIYIYIRPSIYLSIYLSIYVYIYVYM